MLQCTRYKYDKGKTHFLSIFIYFCHLQSIRLSILEFDSAARDLAIGQKCLLERLGQKENDRLKSNDDRLKYNYMLDGYLRWLLFDLLGLLSLNYMHTSP